MSAVMTPPKTAWNWPADLVAHARQMGVEAVLQPMLDFTQQLFPTAREIHTYLEPDVALPDEKFLVYDVRAAEADVPDLLGVHRRWNEELFRLMPRPIWASFVLHLNLEAK